MAISNQDLDDTKLTQAVADNIRTALPHAAAWEAWLMPAVSDAVDEMIARGDVPVVTAEAFEDAGQFLMRVSADIFVERKRRGLSLDDKRDASLARNVKKPGRTGSAKATSRAVRKR